MRINAEDNNKKYQNDKMNLDEAENIYNNRGPTKQSQREKELREKYLRAPAWFNPYNQYIYLHW